MTQTDEEKRRHHFERRCRAARQGRHLPTIDELVAGCPPLGESVILDAHEFAERILDRLPESEDSWALRDALKRLTLGPGVDDFRRAHSLLLAVHKSKNSNGSFSDFDFLDLEDGHEKRRDNQWKWKSRKTVYYADEQLPPNPLS